MAEDKNPEKKPSFFDFSDEEASSWPPKDSVPLDDSPSSSSIEPSDLDPKPAEPEEFDVEDLFSDDFEDSSSKETSSATELPDLEPAPELPELKPISELPDLVPSEAETITPTELDDPVDEDFLPKFKPIQKSSFEAEPDFETSKQELDFTDHQTNDFDFELKSSDDEIPANSELEDEGLVSISQPFTEAIDDQFEKQSVDALYNDYSTPSPDPVSNIIDESQETLPFRTFTTYDYSEEGLTEADLNDIEEEKPGINRNILIVIAVLLLIGGWYGFQSIFSREFKSDRNRDRKARSKKVTKVELQDKELIPIWELSNQNLANAAGESILIKDMYYEAGRQNPFMLPDSVLADMTKAAELEMIKNQKPNTYRRRAYRATLIGVLTSTKNTVALVDYQEAVFDVLEDTSKEKILKLATKAMDKTKEDTHEMIVGSFIGPWQITKIDAPEDPFVEPRITIEHNHESKILSMGKAMELGIFDEEGNFDNLENPISETVLDEFKW